MLNEAGRKKLLDKILNSKEFCGSSIYKSYLEYLVEASFKDESLKEITIAIDFFKKDADFNPAEDTIVRSHSYQLRKKLDLYYLTEGKHEKYRLSIPKGHYKVNIIEATDTYFNPQKVLKSIGKYYPYLIILFLGIALTWNIIVNRKYSKQLEAYKFVTEEDFIWGEFVQSNLPILIIPGNHYLYNMYCEQFDRTLSIRDVEINSQEEFELFRRKYPNLNLEETPEPYFPHHSIWSLPPLLNILFSTQQKPILRRSSNISPQILNEYNIIYIGSIKSLYILKHTIEISNFDFTITPHKVTYTHPDSGIVKEFSTTLHSSGPNEDLVIALKLPGPNENSIFLIASYHSLGAPEIVRYLTSQETKSALSDHFIDKFGSTPAYFELLFRVTGIDKTAYSTEILISNIIEE